MTMEFEKFKIANKLQKEIYDTENALRHFEVCERQKERGFKMMLKDSDSLGFELPNEATDTFLYMAKSALENKLNQLKNAFDEL